MTFNPVSSAVASKGSIVMYDGLRGPEKCCIEFIIHDPGQDIQFQVIFKDASRITARADKFAPSGNFNTKKQTWVPVKWTY